jgi:hypothetical protein
VSLLLLSSAKAAHGMTRGFGLALANKPTVSCGSAKEFKVYQIRMHYITKNLVNASGFANSKPR